jgi:ABC-type multidrug transport system permease subunit
LPFLPCYEHRSNLSVQNIIPVTVAGRLPFYREIASNTYAPFAHHISIGVAEIPFAFVATTVFTVIFYFMIGLDPGSFWFFYILNQIFVYMTLVRSIRPLFENQSGSFTITHLR